MDFDKLPENENPKESPEEKALRLAGGLELTPLENEPAVPVDTNEGLAAVIAAKETEDRTAYDSKLMQLTRDHIDGMNKMMTTALSPRDMATSEVTAAMEQFRGKIGIKKAEDFGNKLNAGGSLRVKDGQPPVVYSELSPEHPVSERIRKREEAKTMLSDFRRTYPDAKELWAVRSNEDLEGYLSTPSDVRKALFRYYMSAGPINQETKAFMQKSLASDELGEATFSYGLLLMTKGILSPEK